MQRELLIAKRKKAKELQQKGWSIDKIARHLVSSWRSVSRWIEMESLEEDNRGWEKGRLRKYDKQVEQRVIDIRQELRATESYFFGPQVVQAKLTGTCIRTLKHRRCTSSRRRYGRQD